MVLNKLVVDFPFAQFEDDDVSLRIIGDIFRRFLQDALPSSTSTSVGGGGSSSSTAPAPGGPKKLTLMRLLETYDYVLKLPAYKLSAAHPTAVKIYRALLKWFRGTYGDAIAEEVVQSVAGGGESYTAFRNFEFSPTKLLKMPSIEKLLNSASASASSSRTSSKTKS